MIEIATYPLGRLSTNCYIVSCTITKKAAVIDPSDDGLFIARQIDEAGLTVTHILLTHTHFDHVGGLKTLQELWPTVPVYLHQDATELLAHAQAAGERWNVAIAQPDPADKFLSEGDVITVGNVALSVLHTPGHAPGHVTFYAAAAGVAFVGDVLFQGSIGRTDFPGCSFEQLMQSIEDKLLVLPNDTAVYPGHGAATTIGREKVSNPFLSG